MTAHQAAARQTLASAAMTMKASAVKTLREHVRIDG
jgi:hypothetical protein